MPKLFLIPILCLFAFNLNGQSLDEKLIGTWSYVTDETTSNVGIYKKVRKTRKFTRSYRFETDGKVFVRTNGSGCSVVKAKGKTVKFPLDEILGSWTLVNDSLVQVKYEAGLMGEFLENVRITEDKLTIQLATE
jgi:hypothetical protein